MYNRRTFLRGIEPESKIGLKGIFKPDYEEPTYLTFRVFMGNSIIDGSYNNDSLTWPADQNKVGPISSYEHMPTPLFQLKSPEDMRREAGALNNANALGSLGTDFVYSAYEYLYNSNQATRAEMLLDFVQGWSELQYNNQYFFTKVSGISEALKVKADNGQRLKDGTKITITVRDSVDQRVRYLLSMYRRIAWDDTYQRWALPDMMRYFRLYIFVSEVRSFHKVSRDYKTAENKGADNSTPKTLGQKVTKGLRDYGKSAWEMTKKEAKRSIETLTSIIPETGIPSVDNYIDEKTNRNKVGGLNGSINKTPEYSIENIMKMADFVYKAVDNIAPVTLYEFDMCDFDIESLNNLANSSYGNETSEESKDFNFSINIRQLKVTEHYNIITGAGTRWPHSEDLSFAKHIANDELGYPIKMSEYFNDDIINKLNRNLTVGGDTIFDDGYYSDELGFGNIFDQEMGTYDNFVENTMFFNDNIRMNTAELNHIPGVAYHKNDLSTGIDPNKIGSKMAANSLLTKLTSSAIKSVFSMGVNKVKDTTNKLMNKPIGSTNVTVTSIFAALKTGNAAALFKTASTAVDGLRDPAGNAIGLRGQSYKTIVEGALAKIASVSPTDEVQLKNTLTSRELLAPGREKLFDDLLDENKNIDFVNVELDKIYEESFQKFKQSQKNRDDNFKKESIYVDNKIYDAKFELARLIITDNISPILPELGFVSTTPLGQIEELNLAEPDKIKLILQGIDQNVIKFADIPHLEFIAAGINKFDMSGPTFETGPNQLDLLGPYYTTNPGYIKLVGPLQIADKPDIELTAEFYTVNPNSPGLLGPYYTVDKNDLSLLGPYYVATKNEKLDLTGPDQTLTPQRKLELKRIYDHDPNNQPLIGPIYKDTKDKPKLLGPYYTTEKKDVPLYGPFYTCEPGKELLKGPFYTTDPSSINMIGPYYVTNPNYQKVNLEFQETVDNKPDMYIEFNSVSKNEDAIKKDKIDMNIKEEIDSNRNMSKLEFNNEQDINDNSGLILKGFDQLKMFEDSNSNKTNSSSEFNKNLKLEGENKKHTPFNLAGPNYSVQPNKDFLKGKYVQIHPDNPAKSKLVNREKVYVDNNTDKSAVDKTDTLTEMRNNIFNKR